ncbi:Wall-associated receptor kinase galacturonan-binding domain-containing protein [Dioscorea alata]|uniref:Wall-associated receptor kinase galacturonan-binding domain-containing protein n=1 Tax=Dioscorea alata TaxID=55571 RepID=A0ACB7UG46_DIOAL|nr:Wall-associated receptor kinase galacturonan-binding domain-containing protein [Dioscorea alata]
MACSSAAAAALLSAILLLLLFFSSSTTLVSAGDHCPPSSCGNLTNIRNPLRLKGDPSECGDPNYELTCDHLNRTILTLLSNNYYVTNITYYDYLIEDYVYFNIQVMYVGMEKSNNGSCNHLPLSATPLTVSNLSRNEYYMADSYVTLVNCSKEVKNKSMHYYKPVACLSHNNNNSFIYLINSWNVRYLVPSCRFIAMFPVQYNKYINLDWLDPQPVDIIEFLGQGFTLFPNIRSSTSIRHCLRTSIRSVFISNRGLFS